MPSKQIFVNKCFQSLKLLYDDPKPFDTVITTNNSGEHYVFHTMFNKSPNKINNTQ